MGEVPSNPENASWSARSPEDLEDELTGAQEQQEPSHANPDNTEDDPDSPYLPGVTIYGSEEAENPYLPGITIYGSKKAESPHDSSTKPGAPEERDSGGEAPEPEPSDTENGSST